jgi:hypothetical protein
MVIEGKWLCFQTRFFAGGITMPHLQTAGGTTLETFVSPLTRLGLIGLLCLFLLFSFAGCGADLTGLLGSVTTDATLSDLVGTWTGTITTNDLTQNYQFTVDSSGNFVAGDQTPGTATITTAGTVTFTYATGGLTVSLKGSMNSAKTKIVMTTSSWTGGTSGSGTFAGTLTKSGSGNFTAADLVGTWAGSMTENGKAENYSFPVDAAGNFISGSGTTGTATISSSGTVVFSYVSGGYSGTFQGIMSSNKTQIVMSTHTWAGVASGTAAFTGTLSKFTSSLTTFTSNDLVGTWAGSLTENGQAQNYQFIVDASGNFVAGDNTPGTAAISSNGTVTFTYTSGGYTITLQGTMSSDKKQIVMTTSAWTGTATGSAAFTGTLTKS